MSNETLQMPVWQSAITSFADGALRLRGVDIADLIAGASFAETVGLLLAGKRPSADEAQIIDAILVACADHGPTSPSTFAGRVIASGNRRAPEAAVAGGVLAIGDAHGGAGEAAVEMLQAAESLMNELGSPRAAADEIVKQFHEAGQRVPGLGHRFHTVDPRTQALWRLAKASGTSLRSITLLETIEEALADHSGKRRPINVDGAIAAILTGMGYAPLAARLVFLIGRTAGLAAHVSEELDREKPLRFRFPYQYDGP